MGPKGPKCTTTWGRYGFNTRNRNNGFGNILYIWILRPVREGDHGLEHPGSRALRAANAMDPKINLLVQVPKQKASAQHHNAIPHLEQSRRYLPKTISSILDLETNMPGPEKICNMTAHGLLL